MPTDITEVIRQISRAGGTVERVTTQQLLVNGLLSLNDTLSTLDAPEDQWLLQDIPTDLGAQKTFVANGFGGLVAVDQIGGSGQTSYGESVGNTSRTATGFIDKVSLDVEVPATTDYIISYSAEMNSMDSGTRARVRVRLDNSTTLGENDALLDSTSATGYFSFAGFVVTELTAGTRQLDIEFASSLAGKEVNIRKAQVSAFVVNKLN